MNVFLGCAQGCGSPYSFNLWFLKQGSQTACQSFSVYVFEHLKNKSVLGWLIKNSSAHLKGISKKNVKSAGVISQKPLALAVSIALISTWHYAAREPVAHSSFPGGIILWAGRRAKGRLLITQPFLLGPNMHPREKTDFFERLWTALETVLFSLSLEFW